MAENMSIKKWTNSLATRIPKSKKMDMPCHQEIAVYGTLPLLGLLM